MKNGIRFLWFFIFLCVPALFFASSVSILMYQKDGGTETVRASTQMIESGVLEALFDRGHIVSSGETAKADSDITESVNLALKNSAEGFFEFMVQITVYYRDTIPENPAQIIFDDIQRVDWKVMRVRNKNCIAEKADIIPKKFEYENDIRAIKRFSQEIGYAIEKVIQGTR